MNTLYIVCGLGVASLLAELINFRKRLIQVLIVGLAVAIYFSLRDWGTPHRAFGDMVVFDHPAVAFSCLICSIAFFWFWMAQSYFHDDRHVTDQAALVLFVIVGALLLACFNNMAMLFLGIEILSLSLYVLAGGRKGSLLSNEAAFKYFLMGSFATGFLLMGITLVYGATGLFHVNKIAAAINANPSALPGFFYAGMLLIIVGLAFKVSAVPFHFWAPDVYEGAPTVITALMATLVKTAAFAALFRMLAYCFPQMQSSWQFVLQSLTVATLVIANVTAVYQVSVKRMLAYSSVGHAGYILLALVGGGRGLGSVVFYYLAAYSVATLTAFCVLSMVEQENSTSIEGFNGLFKRNPFVAVAMSMALLSMAGIPPLAGFLAKYLVFSQAIQRGLMGLVIIGVLTSLVGVYYYFRVIVAMFFKDATSGAFVVPPATKTLLWVLMLLTLFIGLFPDRLLVL